MNYRIKTNGVVYEVEIHKVEGNIAHLTVNEMDFEVEVEGMTITNPTRMSSDPNPVSKKERETALVKPKTQRKAHGLKSPLPGTILNMLVSKGEAVKKGQVLLVLEAMKMENSIEAEDDGVIEKINFNKGDSVLEGDVLLIIK